MKNFLKSGFYNNVIMTILINYLKKIVLIELDYISIFYIKKFFCKSSTINFKKFKFSICLSTEFVICHGIPINKKINFNLMKIDLCIKKIFYSDSCYNFCKNSINKFIKKFFFYIINKIKLNEFYSKIGYFLNKNNFKKIEIIEEYCSHGIYKKMHNNLIINHNKNNYKKKIKNFDSFTIEPMINYGKNKKYHFKKIFFNKKNFSFQWEHTLIIFNLKKILTTIRKTELCIIL